jgi:hypothetical protein
LRGVWITVLVHFPTSRIFELNETGTRVWEMLGQGLDADRIVERLVDEFDVEDARVADEVKDLLSDCKTRVFSRDHGSARLGGTLLSQPGVSRTMYRAALADHLWGVNRLLHGTWG